MEEVLTFFNQLGDPRSARNQKHPLNMLIGTSLLASLAGQDSFSGIADFTGSHKEKLSEYFDFPHDSPSHDTYQRLWDAISTEEFFNAFSEFTACLKTLDSDYINIDGKTIRNSGSGKALHIVSAWCRANQLTLAQKKVDSKSNEITAIPDVLRLLDLEDRIVTLDAMGAQRAICKQIIEQGGDYVISLKGNQCTLHEDVESFFADEKLRANCLSSEENDKGHGRLETRKAYSTSQIDWLREHDWPGLKSIGMVDSTIIRKNKTAGEKRFYISSLDENARQLNYAARIHWGIENQLHWRLDVVFNEDKACIRNDNAAKNIDILRKWALNVLQKVRLKPSQSIKSIMRKNAMSIEHLVENVNKIFHA